MALKLLAQGDVAAMLRSRKIADQPLEDLLEAIVWRSQRVYELVRTSFEYFRFASISTFIRIRMDN